MAAHAVTDAEEEYLQSIFWLQEAGLPMTAANLARAMQLSAQTVHEMIGRLEKDGYVQIPTGPGLGEEIVPDAEKRFPFDANAAERKALV